MTNTVHHLLPQLIEIAKDAGTAVLSVYNQQQIFAVVEKEDKTPLTQADLRSHQVIVNRLKHLTPHIPVLSEESAYIPFDIRKQWREYWLVDPLDGTKEFLKRNGEFTVNIAFISDNMPTLGIIYAPVLDVCYFAGHKIGAFKQKNMLSPHSIHSKKWNGQNLRVAGSRSHGHKELQNFLDKLNDYQLVTMGSSLKSCLVAEGAADVYPRLGPTSEWDTAAAQCIVEEAGGCILDLEGQKLRYNCKESLLNPWFLVVGDKGVDWLKYFT